jgi:uncharacterized protein (TIGR02147 family)
MKKEIQASKEARQLEKIPAQSLKAREFSQAPTIFKFLDYREFLSDWFRWKKSVTPGFSCTVFARKTGLRSHAFFGMVISGKRNLTPRSIRAFSSAINLKPEEYAYFEKLVLFNQARGLSDRNFYFEQLRHAELASRGSQDLVEKLQNSSALLRHWYTVAIFELTDCSEFQPDRDWIAGALKNRVTPLQAADAWKSLVENRLVQKNESTGRWEKTPKLLDFDPDKLDFVIQNFHLEMLNRATDSIQQDTLQDRELSSLTLAVHEEDLELLKKEIKNFRKRINRQFSREDGKSTRLVAINLQLLTLSKKLGVKI